MSARQMTTRLSSKSVTKRDFLLVKGTYIGTEDFSIPKEVWIVQFKNDRWEESLLNFLIIHNYTDVII